MRPRIKEMLERLSEVEEKALEKLRIQQEELEPIDTPTQMS